MTTGAAALFARRSIPYRVALGWLAFAVLAFQYLLHPMLVAVSASQGVIVPELQPLSLTDVMLLLGAPVAGSAAERVSNPGYTPPPASDKVG